MTETGGLSERSDLSGAIIGRFRLEELLGAGATGEVYRATDTQLHRTVAIKRLAPGARSERSPGHGLLREAQRASALNHPGITGIYDVLTVADEMFLVMEYVDGPTLRARMTSPLSLRAFRDIGVQCAQALGAAHQKGILHGDIKPSNIMLTRETHTVKLCDFGLARRIPAGRARVSDSASTVTGGLAGTPAYMAPEVVLEQTPDARADVFSLGIVFYEMLAGVNPFEANSVVGTLDRIRQVRPPSLDRVNPRVPPSVARLVSRMLEPDRDRRLVTAGEVAAELSSFEPEERREPEPHRRKRWWALTAAMAAVVVALLVAQGLPWRRGADAVGTIPERIHLAVLPFAVAGAGDKAPFAQGLVDELIARLSRLTVGHQLQVASAGDLRARNVGSARDAREQLGANVALTGTLDYAGDRVRVVVRLVDTSSGRDLRSSAFEVEASSPQMLRDDIVEAAVDMMGLTLDGDEQQALAAQERTQPSAYDYYLQARGYLLNYDRLESLDSAVAVFRKALEVDPRYAPAYAGLGQAYWRKYELTHASVWVEPARAACEGALAIDAMSSESHTCLGMVLSGTGAYEHAADQFATALRAEPTSDAAYLGLATAYERMGRPLDAERTYQRAIALRPHYWAAHNNLAAFYYRRRQFDQSLASFQQAVALAPDSFRGYSSIGAVYFMKDQVAEAVAAFEKSMSIRPNYVAASNLGTLFFYDGQFDRSAAAYRQALELERGSYQVWTNLAGALEAAGRGKEAAEAHRGSLALAEEGLRVNPRNVALLMVVADAHAALGDMQRSQAALEQVLRAAPEDASIRFALAVHYESRRGNREAALEWLAKAIASGQTWREIDRLPALRQLRADPRFQDLRRAR